jgi:hypothetical protein
MKSFGLKAPIQAQLKAILVDYPGGQILSEGLQNAEDSGANTFSICLDLMDHCGESLRHEGLEKLRGPSILLVDDGRGFLDSNWTSLMNLNQSEKRNSPRDIGRFGMGSRYIDNVIIY